jgi:hypothetical protein
MKTKLKWLVFIFVFIQCKSPSAIFKENNGYFDREKILNDLSKKLNKMIPKYRSNFGRNKFYVENGIEREFFVWDLVDTTNVFRNYNSKKVYFSKNHIYHFAPRTYEYSISNFLFIDNTGMFYYFYGVNCPNKGDKLNDVLLLLKSKLNNQNNLKSILNNVSNYNNFRLSLKCGTSGAINCDYFKKHL